jgi:hypothetical protein
MVVVIALAALLTLGCNSVTELIATSTPTPQALLIGKWNRTSSRDVNAFSVLLPDQIEFLQDGTWLVPGSGVLNGKYTVLEPHRMKLEGFSIIYTPSFTVTMQGDLTIEDSGIAVEYSKLK